MSAFYGTLQGARGPATRSGHPKTGLKATAQSYEGSVSVRFWTKDGETWATIEAGSGSTANPSGIRIFEGPLADLITGGVLLSPQHVVR